MKIIIILLCFLGCSVFADEIRCPRSINCTSTNWESCTSSNDENFTKDLRFFYYTVSPGVYSFSGATVDESNTEDPKAKCYYGAYQTSVDIGMILIPKLKADYLYYPARDSRSVWTIRNASKTYVTCTPNWLTPPETREQICSLKAV